MRANHCGVDSKKPFGPLENSAYGPRKLSFKPAMVFYQCSTQMHAVVYLFQGIAG